MAVPDPYSTLPAGGPNATALGSAFITLVEPHPGHERAYNRWYEDDHFYSGAMAFPWWFSGRRWVATRELRELRHADGDSVIEPITTGCYLGTYWTTAGRHADQWRWLGATVDRLRAQERMFAERTHVHTAFYDVAGSVSTGPRDFQALDHPYGGLVLEVIDAPEAARRQELESWLESEHAPALLDGSRVGMCVWFTPHARPPDDELWFETPVPDERRLLILWFIEVDPRACWEPFAREAGQVAAAGVGRTRLVAPFVPTVPGTDRYVDELR